ncbi:MAG TPA: response regulator [Negativicutes bacterium]
MARVLVVDDALMMRKTIGTILLKAGHVIVDEAANGEQAVLAYKKHLPELVTMDITMPGVDGIEALGQIVSFDPEAQVVMVSALGQRHKVFDALQAGAKGYVLKPLQEERFLSTINDVLATNSCRNSLPGTIDGQRKVAAQATPIGTYADKSWISEKPFTVENKDMTYHITIIKEFVPADFEALLEAVQQLLIRKPLGATFKFTCCKALNSKVASNFLEIMTLVPAEGGLLRIICYTQDYMVFFRNSCCAKSAEFELVKKSSVQ